MNEKMNKKTTTIYAIVTTDDELHSSIKEYCMNYKIAKRDSMNYYGFWESTPVGEKGIIEIEVVVE